MQHQQTVKVAKNPNKTGEKDQNGSSGMTNHVISM